MPEANQRPAQREVRIRRVSDKMRSDVKNIAAHCGVSVTDLLKVELAKWINSFPERMRTPMRMD